MRRERGVALLTVLLVVALVTLMASSMLARQHLAARSLGNRLEARQAWQLALGGEALARALLHRDLRQGGGERDHPGEAWAQPRPAYPVDGAEIHLRIEDLAGRFNLNALLRNQQRNEPGIAQFRRLLALLALDPALADALLDRLGADATGPLADPSELRPLGLDAAGYRRLAPHVAALPPEVPLNVNSAGPLVLASLVPGAGVRMGEALWHARPAQGYRDSGEFLAQPGLSPVLLAGTELAVSSQYFEAVCDVRLGERRLVLASLLERGADGVVRTLRRDLGRRPAPLEEAP